MNGALQVVPPDAGPVGRPHLGPVIPLHDGTEDFTIYQPAGFRLRWYAITLDLALFAPLDVLIHMPFNRYLEKMGAYGYDGRYLAMTILLWAIPMLLYVVAPTLLWGQTLGKRIVGIRVIKASFNPNLTLGSIIIRETIGKLLSLALLGAGFFAVGFTERKRGLHDYMAKTQVISYRIR